MTEKVRCGAGAGWVVLRGRAGAGCKCGGAGPEQARFLKFLRVRGGSGQKIQPVQDSNQ